ncbi:LSU ribosomal protein L5P [Thermodesulfobium acidiphilum]|uniref:Large ribosomal subunit protein uL5 n=1 Tax=Thermodesulfobium acidiphilum TaxID=1794699 RepID=A0A2R4VZL4_THEAF|nr:50S ribosomal protein L5 [Thermodesulfobium acidiphilum]AWB09868.1 LSU ribosomal protein L5P [Thermodesulfobium acidiphilum]
MKARLKELYDSKVIPYLKDKFSYKNVMEVPKPVKVVINIGLGEAVQNAKAVDAATEDLRVISGQKPIIRRAKKSIAAFKIRQGMPIGLKVTLRGQRMYYFLDKLFNVALPRIRDFKGFSDDHFDGRGNITIGLSEQLVFPEIEYDKIDKVRGMNVTIVTTAKTDKEAKELLGALGFPFRKN